MGFLFKGGLKGVLVHWPVYLLGAYVHVAMSVETVCC